MPYRFYLINLCSSLGSCRNQVLLLAPLCRMEGKAHVARLELYVLSICSTKRSKHSKARGPASKVLPIQTAHLALGTQLKTCLLSPGMIPQHLLCFILLPSALAKMTLLLQQQMLSLPRVIQLLYAFCIEPLSFPRNL